MSSWSSEDELRAEREALGFFITGHPLDRYLKDLRKFTNITVGTLRTRGPELPVTNERPGREGRPRVRSGAEPGRTSFGIPSLEAEGSVEC